MQICSPTTVCRFVHQLRDADLFTNYGMQICSPTTGCRFVHQLRDADLFTNYGMQICSPTTGCRFVHQLRDADLFTNYVMPMEDRNQEASKGARNTFNARCNTDPQKKPFRIPPRLLLYLCSYASRDEINTSRDKMCDYGFLLNRCRNRSRDRLEPSELYKESLPVWSAGEKKCRLSGQKDVL
ncbi:transferase CAF17, mitochondrial X3 [Biomphalaria glabrata]|nr:transferase CAF17, mitochondrial X3 [Biomphalaria glabrata]